MENHKVNDTNKKNTDNILPIAFIVIIFGILFASLIAKDVGFSENENRPLAKFPEVNAKSISSGQFEKDFKSYTQNHVIFHDQFMRLKNVRGQGDGKAR